MGWRPELCNTAPMSMIAPMTLKESGYPLLAAALLPLLRAGDVVCLEGDLGAGKTALARHLIRAAVGEPVEVPSPTFTLVQTYDSANGLTLWHFDLYRIARPDEIFELGWDDVRAHGVALVEWSERLGNLRPANRLDIALAAIADDDALRTISLTPHGNWVDRLAGFATITSPQQN